MMMMTYRQKCILKALGLIIVSPVYVPAVILYDHRSEFAAFYKEAFMVLRDTHPDLEEEKNG
jgi:hypothetical protein